MGQLLGIEAVLRLLSPGAKRTAAIAAAGALALWLALAAPARSGAVASIDAPRHAPAAEEGPQAPLHAASPARRARPAAAVRSGADLVAARAAAVAEGRVRVVDVRTGDDLHGLDVVPAAGHEPPGSLPTPAALARARRVARSPFALPAAGSEVAQRSYWLGAEGFAWRHVEPPQGGETALYALALGGALRVDAAPPRDRSQRYELRLLDAAGTPVAARPLDGRAITLAGLAPGRYRARFVALHDRFADVCITERAVTVAAAETVELTLDLAALWRPADLGDIQLTVVLADERDRDALTLAVEALDADEPRRVELRSRSLDRVAAGELAGGTGPRRVGRHRITALPGTASIDVDVRSGSTTSALLVVPPLPKLKLWPVDATDGAPVQPDVVLWRPRGAPDWRQAPHGALLLGVARGGVEVGVVAAGYRTYVAELELDTEWREELVELERAELRPLVVRLSRGGASVPAPDAAWSATTVTDLAGRPVLATVQAHRGADARDGASALFLLEGPGPYRLTLGEVPGFARAPTRLVPADARELEQELTLLAER
ncbi:MAG: hypothetical protein AAF682_13115 [Planctomycetota bacterium]